MMGVSSGCIFFSKATDTECHAHSMYSILLEDAKVNSLFNFFYEHILHSMVLFRRRKELSFFVYTQRHVLLFRFFSRCATMCTGAM